MYVNLDRYSEQLLNQELARLDEIEMDQDLNESTLYLVQMESEDGDGYEELCGCVEEVAFLVDEAEARGLTVTVEEIEI